MPANDQRLTTDDDREELRGCALNLPLLCKIPDFFLSHFAKKQL